MHVRWVSPEAHLQEPLQIEFILGSGNLTRSIAGRQLENEARRRIGRQCVAVSSGTAAIWAGLQVLQDIRPGTVIVPAFGFPATPRMAMLAGMHLMIVDVEEDAPVISADAVEEAIDHKVSIVAVTDYFDIVVDCQQIRRSCGSHPVAIMEDSAGSFLARDGTLHACSGGDISVASLHASKIVTTGEGGLIFTDSDDLHKRLACARANGLAETVWYRASDQVGMNLAMPELSAMLGLESFRTSDYRIEARRRIRRSYEDRLQFLTQSGSVQRLRGDLNQSDRFGPLSICVDHRDFVLRTLRLGGVEARVCWASLASEDPVISPKVTRIGDLKRSRRWRDRIINLPVHEGMTESMVDYVISILERALKSFGCL